MLRIEFIEEPKSEQETAPISAVEDALSDEKPAPPIEAEEPTKTVPPEQKPVPRSAPQKAASPADDAPHLVVMNGPLEGERIALTAPFTLGRKDSCDLVIPDRKSSGEHARIERQGDRWIITDLNSGNGLFIGKNRVSKHKLVDGDIVVIGDTGLRMRGLPTDPAMNDASSASQVFRAVDEGGTEQFPPINELIKMSIFCRSSPHPTCLVIWN